MKKLLTTLVSLCIVLVASAQQDVVSGRIMGSDSLSVPGVAVVMQTLDSTYINAEVSDADGYFRIQSSSSECSWAIAFSMVCIVSSARWL